LELSFLLNTIEIAQSVEQNSSICIFDFILKHSTAIHNVNMKEAIVHPDLSVEIKETPIPTAGEHQVVIKVVVSGLNPKDWKIPKVYVIALPCFVSPKINVSKPEPVT
jgi:hypothetical protein